jgi:hypothetical protein
MTQCTIYDVVMSTPFLSFLLPKYYVNMPVLRTVAALASEDASISRADSPAGDPETPLANRPMQHLATYA